MTRSASARKSGGGGSFFSTLSQNAAAAASRRSISAGRVRDLDQVEIDRVADPQRADIGDGLAQMGGERDLEQGGHRRGDAAVLVAPGPLKHIRLDVLHLDHAESVLLRSCP